MIERRCTYCNKQLEPNDRKQDQSLQVSHGICRDCLAVVMAGQGQSLASFLRQLDVHTIVVDQYKHRLFDNFSAQQSDINSPPALSQLLDSEVFGCTYLEDPENCPGTIHCLSCAIQTAVDETYQTGHSKIDIPACHDLDNMAGLNHPHFFISTEKCGHSVFLTIKERKEID